MESGLNASRSGSNAQLSFVAGGSPLTGAAGGGVALDWVPRVIYTLSTTIPNGRF